MEMLGIGLREAGKGVITIPGVAYRDDSQLPSRGRAEKQ